MSQDQLRQLLTHIKKLVQSLVSLSEEERETLLQRAEQMTHSQLQRTLYALEKTAKEEKAIFRGLFSEDTSFLEKFHLFGTAQLQRLNAEAFHIHGRQLFQQLFETQKLWRNRP